MSNTPLIDQTPAWQALQAHKTANAYSADIRAALSQDAGRFAHFCQTAAGITADLSKNAWNAATENLLLQLADAASLAAKRDAMFGGEPINATEGRAVMHWLLRTPKDGAATLPAALQDAHQDVHTTLDAMLAYAESVRKDTQLTDIVNIGIGGSDLGPQMAVRALQAFGHAGKRLHFVSNVDGHELDAVLKTLDAKRTLFLIASKTFTTIETMTNAQSAKAWFLAQGGTDTARHFAALTTNVAAAKAFGISTTFGFWDWVGGRYSMWSAIGLPLAIAIGADGFRAFLAGAHAMDEHFKATPLAQNLPVRLGLLDVWYRNFLGYSSRSIAPYHSFLARVPAYLQQLEMESNGKQVDMHGRALGYDTSPVLWGEAGTNGQHAYFQMLHQGTTVTPLEFIAVKTPAHALGGHHLKLLANALAQAQALLQGKADVGGHKHFAGNRPSTFFLLDALTPFSLGAFIAMYEHRVFVSGAVWGINSFDQWGVELGKVLAKDIEPRLASGDMGGLDASTAGLLALLRA